MNFDKYMNKKYNIFRYNCWDFVRDVWYDFKKEDIGKRTPSCVSKINIQSAFDLGIADFKKIYNPGCDDLSIVLIKKPASLPHVGIHYDNKVLSLTKQGVSYVPLKIATRFATEVNFYVYINKNI